MKTEEWLYEATRRIRFPPDREAVRRELLGHLEEKTAAYMEQGRTFYDAEAAAVEDMGSPEEISRELGRIHRPWWGYIWQASRVFLICVIVIMSADFSFNKNHIVFSKDQQAVCSRPELPEGEITQNGREPAVLARWRPTGAKRLGIYRVTSPMVWLEAGEGANGPIYTLAVCLRADTWRFWEPCFPDNGMILDHAAVDSRGAEYARPEVRENCRGYSCETWLEPFTTWYLLGLEVPSPEAVPEWVDIPVGYGGCTVRVELEREAVW